MPLPEALPESRRSLLSPLAGVTRTAFHVLRSPTSVRDVNHPVRPPLQSHRESSEELSVSHRMILMFDFYLKRAHSAPSDSLIASSPPNAAPSAASAAEDGGGLEGGELMRA